MKIASEFTPRPIVIISITYHYCLVIIVEIIIICIIVCFSNYLRNARAIIRPKLNDTITTLGKRRKADHVGFSKRARTITFRLGERANAIVSATIAVPIVPRSPLAPLINMRRRELGCYILFPISAAEPRRCLN